jgi:hypothetical protein
VDHEFDHVAISTDERPKLILRHLILSAATIERDLPPETPVTKELIASLVHEEAEAYKEAVRALIKQNYERLDEVSRHGTRDIPDRHRFFEELYSPQGLERQKFAHLDRIRDLLRSDEYRRARRYYAE